MSSNNTGFDENKEIDKKVYSKTQLRFYISIVIIVVLVGIIIWLFSIHNDENFVSHFSFASTITSIVLSVLAIFMSVSGESKTQAIRDKIEREADEIMETTRRWDDRMKAILDNTNDIRATVNINQDSSKINITSGQYDGNNSSTAKVEQ